MQSTKNKKICLSDTILQGKNKYLTLNKIMWESIFIFLSLPSDD
jgi:hypothetical protein